MANEELHFLADQEFCAAIGIDEQTLRIGCARLAYRLNPLNVLPSVFKEEVRSGIAALGWDGWIDVSKLRLPSGNKWTDTDAVEDGALRWSSIHSFKGLQSPAVALVIPQSSREYDSGVAFWEKNEPHEARRVLYVGASRAERLIVLFVHDSQCDAVVACLERDAVPFTHDTI
jgi:hypothetical protein